MVTLFVYYLHTVAAAALFTKRWQETDWKEGILGVGFLALVFGVGWSMSTFVLKLIVDAKGFGVLFDRDALSLLLLVAVESLFFYVQLRRKGKPPGGF